MESEVANWKRLTNTDGMKVDVNMDNVAYIQGLEDYTLINFVAGRGDGVLSVAVTEKPDAIHMANSLRSM
jgi:hypothetical protein